MDFESFVVDTLT